MLFFKYLMVGCLFLSPLGGSGSDRAMPPGIMEGYLHIVSPKPIELVDGTAPTVTAATYAEYPLVVLGKDREKEVATVTADGSGHYHLVLPPGVYILDVQDRVRKHVRAKPREFEVISNQKVRVDMDMDTGIR